MTKKIGEGHAAAMARLGLRELRAAAFPDSNVAQTPEYGLYGTLTPGEVAESRRDGGLHLEEERTGHRDSILGRHLREAERREDRAEPTRDQDRDR